MCCYERNLALNHNSRLRTWKCILYIKKNFFINFIDADTCILCSRVLETKTGLLSILNEAVTHEENYCIESS